MTKTDPPEQPPEERTYIVYDARAQYDEDEASILFSCDSLKEAKQFAADFGPGVVIYSYAIVNGIATDKRREV